MLITLISLLLAVLTSVYVELFSLNFDFTFLAILMLIGGTTILIIVPFIDSLLLSPLQKLEQELVPHLMELYRRDKLLHISHFFLFLFPLISYVLAAAITFFNIPHKIILFSGWIFLLGAVLDLIRDTLKRSTNFLNPSYLINMFTHEAKYAIQNEEDEILWGSLDTLSEMTLQAIEHSKIALSTKTLNAFPPIIHTFFASSKSISHINQDKKIEEKTGQDEASYTLFYFLQRLQTINEKALNYNLETVCSHIIVVLGKIIVNSAQFDLSMVSLPTHFLGKFALKALARNFNEVSHIAISTLLEIAKTIVTDIDITYADLQTPFQAIINSLDAIAKETFKKDKTINIQVLIQPLKDLRTLFQTEKMANHRDTPIIIQSIDSILAEYTTLEQVMKSMPSISSLKDASSSSS